MLRIPHRPIPRLPGRTRAPALATAVATAAVLLPAAPAAPAAHAAPPPPERAFTLPAGLAEISGLAMSVKHPGVAYAHNDSGNTTEVFAIDTATGALRAKLNVTNAPNTDWEGMAVTRSGIHIGDIGNNFGGRDPIVYRLPEPDTLANASLTATRYQLRFADGAKDAESLLVDPLDDQLYVAGKNIGSAGKLYRAPNPLSTAQTNTLADTGRAAPAFATDGAFSPDGKAYALRSGGPIGENAAWIYNAAGTELATVTLPSQGQGEAITYFDRGSVLVASENDTQVWRVHLPPEAIPDPGTPGDPPSVTAPGDQTGKVGTPVSLQVRASDPGGLALTFTATGLPAGLAISESGLVTGVPATEGTFTVTVTATNTAGKAGSATFAWRIAPANGGEGPAVANPGDQTGVFNKAVNLQIRASGGTGAITYKAEGLPFGLSVGSSSGTVTGKPWHVGTFSVKVTATDTAARSAVTTFRWTVTWF
ncbi:Ig domain-containing protein [Actinomadura fulvescens]